MKCIICNGSVIEPKNVDEQIRSGEDIVLLAIRVPVCSSCGERYYDRQTIKRIEEIRSKIMNGELRADEVGKIYRTCAA
jgi:YgiT-type zinc finger domain-containing protein